MKTIYVVLIISLLFINCSYAHPIDMKALATIESNNNPNACSYKGCKYGRGLYQISDIVLEHYNNTYRDKCLFFDKNGEAIYISGEFSSGPDSLGKISNGELLCNNKFENKDLFNPKVNEIIGNWYLNWLYDRCWTVEDTLIAWNWGIGNWRKWKRNCHFTQRGQICSGQGEYMPKETQDFLKKYNELTKE